MVGLLDISATEATVLMNVANGCLMWFDVSPKSWFPVGTAPDGPCWAWMSRGDPIVVATWEVSAIEQLQASGLLDPPFGAACYQPMPTRDGAQMITWLSEEGWMPS
jgi:hypothetical protein